jgi:hypothetical protein
VRSKHVGESRRTVEPSARAHVRLAFGSRVISGYEVFDYLPEPEFPKIDNLREFAGAYALDKWLCNCDGRQVVFSRKESQPHFRAHFIDFGYCFNAGEWSFPDAPLRGVYARKAVYQHVCGWQSFEPWLTRIESFDLLKLWEIAADVPPEWAEPERLAQLIECIDARRNCVRELIAAVRQSPHNPFGAWTEQQP